MACLASIFAWLRVIMWVSLKIYMGYAVKSPYVHHLVGGFNPSEKYEFVSWDDYSKYMESH